MQDQVNQGVGQGHIKHPFVQKDAQAHADRAHLSRGDVAECLVRTLPDGYIHTNPLPQIPTTQSVPTSRECLPGYFGIPIVISTLRSLIGPVIGKVQTPWLSFH